MASHKLSSAETAEAPFGSWLRRLREDRGLPLRAVAAAAEMDQAHLSKSERGQRLLTPRQTLAIANFFKIDPIETDARRIAEKFRMEHGASAAANQALSILKTGLLGRTKRAAQRKPRSRK